MSFSKYSYFPVICGAATLLAGASATNAAPLTLADALATALQNNPTLKVHAFGSRIAEARLLQAGIAPNPELSVEFEDFLGTGSSSGVDRLQTTLQLSKVIDLADSRGRAVESAAISSELVQSEYEMQRINVFAEVARRFTETAADTQRLLFAQSALEIGQQTVRAVEARVDAAKASPLELSKARTALALLEIDEEHAEHELAVCRQSLAAVLGSTSPTFTEINADLLSLPAVPEFSVVVARLAQSPILARYPIESRWYEAQALLAQSQRRAGLRVNAGLRRNEATDDFGFVAGISLPLQARDQMQGKEQEARELRAQVTAKIEASRLELHATLFAVYQEMQHANTALTALREKIIPEAETSLRLARQGYESGRFSLLELLDTQQSLITLRGAIITHATAFHLRVIELERLLGAPLTAAPAQS